MIYDLIDTLVKYGLDKKLINPLDETFIRNQLLSFLKLNDYKPGELLDLSLEEMMDNFDDYAVENNLINDTVTERDNFDTALMTVITPHPSEVIRQFNELYQRDRGEATDYFYHENIDSNYIRKYRVDRDLKWVTATPYGDLDITINLSKPEKDPKDIARARNMPKNNYPICLLCHENEGFAGTLTHPARGNIRLIPLSLDNESFYLQYSPYSYYNEHCIVLNKVHKPMVIDESTIRKLLKFLDFLPHYFVGSNADLPIVGGSILAHEHFQGGRYVFSMDKAESIYKFNLEGVDASIIKWPLSVIRLEGKDKDKLVKAYSKVMNAWINYSNEKIGVVAYTNGERHNTITPISRMHGDNYQLDLVLRCNITTEEYPSGVFHPHPEYHNIKKENIGLIEVMGLAVLPRRLKDEMAKVAEYLIEGKDIASDEQIAKHASWAESIKSRRTLTKENIEDVLHEEIGKTFAKILENAGVFKQDEQGIEEFKKFVKSL